MYTRVLLASVFRAALWLIGLAVLIAYFGLSPRHAFGVLIGGVLFLVDGGGLVYLVGRLMDSGVSTSRKSALTLALVVKFVAVAALVYLSLFVWGVSGEGLLIGLGVGLASLVLGLTWGSSSPAGREAMAEAEAKIREEMGDNEDQSR